MQNLLAQFDFHAKGGHALLLSCVGRQALRSIRQASVKRALKGFAYDVVGRWLRGWAVRENYLEWNGADSRWSTSTKSMHALNCRAVNHSQCTPRKANLQA